MAKLLIVESPGKIKTLRKILGPGWILEASVGHTTELAHDGYKKLGFDIGEDQVVTRYIPRGPRGKQVLSKLRAAVKAADQVYLAMDPDREGEAIAWHLVEQLKLKRFERVTYTQITESAVKAAIQKPRRLDYPLIHAQRARQCLDKLVGYEVSPLLWNTTGGKSAGRVQSATLHLVCERERERLAFVPKDYWTLESQYREGFTARYEPLRPAAKDDPDAATRVESAAEAQRIEKIARTHPHIVEKMEEREDRRFPLPPLITSSLQQTAGVRLKYSPQKTMKIAQELYEGVGGTGLITYMRTDAITLSPEFVQETRDWLSAHHPEALPQQAPSFRVKADAQGAHEAIRPTTVSLTPDKARSMLNDEQHAVYKLIWERAVASQCKPARLAKNQIEIHAGETRWIARGLLIIDPGYLIFWRNIEEEKELPVLRLKQVVNLKDIKVEKRTTQPPPRYSEAKLVQLMEKLGIGRPSTYASTIMTLRDRDYVVLDKGALAPTPLGMSTDEILMRAMPDLVSVSFTAQMEESLDRIAEDKIGWEKFLSDWNHSYLKQALINAHSALRDVPKKPYSPRGAGGGSGGGARGRSSRSGASRAEGGATSAKSAGPRRPRRARSTSARGAARSAGPRAAAATVATGDAPACEFGHGLQTARVSKKGDPYWKCPHPGCESWTWPGKTRKRST